MDGVFKLCLAGILQSDVDEFKNALYLEVGGGRMNDEAVTVLHTAVDLPPCVGRGVLL